MKPENREYHDLPPQEPEPPIDKLAIVDGDPATTKAPSRPPGERE